jgi:hypothetical protein
MVKKTKRIILAAILCGLCTFAQDVKDPGGWKNLKWGMSRIEVHRVMPESTDFVTKRHQNTFGVPNLFLLDKRLKCDVTLTFNESDLFDGVMLGGFSSGGPNGTFVSEPASAVSEYTKMILLEWLTDKYGNPTQARKEENRSGGGEDHFWVWIFPSTKITLNWIEYTDPSYQDLNKTVLFYAERRKSADL